jgi:hypothetical protein
MAAVPVRGLRLVFTSTNGNEYYDQGTSSGVLIYSFQVHRAGLLHCRIVSFCTILARIPAGKAKSGADLIIPLAEHRLISPRTLVNDHAGLHILHQVLDLPIG